MSIPKTAANPPQPHLGGLVHGLQPTIVQLPDVEVKTVRGWHWIHRWSKWSRPEQASPSWVVALFGSDVSRKVQQRVCVRCGKAQERKIVRQDLPSGGQLERGDA